MSEEKSLIEQVGALTKPDNSQGMMTVQSSRAIAEIQGQMTIAKRFPRDELAAYARIIKACKRPALAEVAVYEYPRGGQKVTGPSIRLAEALAQNWGNMSTGVIELERKDGESIAMAYAIDLETNYRKEMTFSVPHNRDTREAKKKLTDDRDIYERVANDGSRRLRNCILAVIPGDIVDGALRECDLTFNSDQKPIVDRVRDMLVAMDQYGVKREMIESLFGCKLEAVSNTQLTRLRGIYQSLKDGMGSVTDYFKPLKTDTADSAMKAMEKPLDQKGEATKIADSIKKNLKPGDFGYVGPDAK